MNRVKKCAKYKANDIYLYKSLKNIKNFDSIAREDAHIYLKFYKPIY